MSMISGLCEGGSFVAGSALWADGAVYISETLLYSHTCPRHLFVPIGTKYIPFPYEFHANFVQFVEKASKNT